MMSCTRLYLYPTKSLIGQVRKNRLAQDKKLPTCQLHGAIALREHTPLKNGKWFLWSLNFSKEVAWIFLPIRRPYVHPLFRGKIQNIVF